MGRPRRSRRGPLILADHDVHAELQALANLLDDPEVGTAVLLAHNGIDELNPVVLATPESISESGAPVGRSAGVLRIDPSDRATFAAWPAGPWGRRPFRRRPPGGTRSTCSPTAA